MVKHKKIASNFYEVKIDLPEIYLALYFSYETIIAYRYGNQLQVCENVWSRTTGEHLNYLNPIEKKRLPFEVFNSKLNQLFAQLDNPISSHAE